MRTTTPTAVSVVGQGSKTQWGQVFIAPTAYGVLEIESKDGVARERGVSALTALSEAFSFPPVSLAGLSALADRIAKEHALKSLILLVPFGTSLFVVLRGSGRVYIKRGKTSAPLLTGTGDIAGSVQKNDTLIAVTAGGLGFFQSKQAAEVFLCHGPSEVKELVAPLLSEQAGADGAALLVLEVADGVFSDPVVQPKKETTRQRAMSVVKSVTTPAQRQAVRRAMGIVQTKSVGKKRRLIVGAIVCFCLLGIGIGVRGYQTRSVRTAITEKIDASEHLFDEGMALLDINPVKGRQRLTEAKAMLAPILSKKLKTADGQRAERLYANISENVTRAMHIVHITPQLYYDMALVKKGARASKISLNGETLAVYDDATHTVFAVGVPSKSGTIVGGGAQFVKTGSISLSAEKIYAWTPEGIHVIRLSDTKTEHNLIPKDPQWGAVSSLVAFGGNVYLLDTQKSRIWKYVSSDVTKNGFSELYEYLNPDTLPDLSQATSMSIDGSVWVGTTKGTILRFTAGKDNPFVPEGLDTPLGTSLTPYVSDGNALVYVLDIEHNRVVAFTPDGLYRSQYVWDNTLPITDFAVSESLRMVLFVANGAVYSGALE